MLPEDRPDSVVVRIGLRFASALTRGDWASAYELLASHLRDDWQPADLKRRYEQMTGYWEEPSGSLDIGFWDDEYVYVAIKSQFGSEQEAVTVSVAQEGDNFLITEVVWGRP